MDILENTIRVLPEYLANQIAAGEVVQRPESIVKELVENSLDAGADSIAVIVRGSGKSLIHIVDNGKGMSKSDLAIAPLRHSTSKIQSQKDLERIISYGFRGEALASITAVASIEIRSKRAIDEHGWSLKSEPLREFEIAPANCDNGTQVFVRNLFYNVPARKKFLKSDLTEFRYISDTMIRFAISHFDKRFTFYDNDTMIFDVHPSAQDIRIKNVLGKSLEGGLIPINFIDEKVEITGFIGLPHLAKPASSNQYLFVNKRAVQSKNLNYAIFSAFEHLLEKNYKPLYVLNLAVDPERVDVNIHPQKNEVKFEDDRVIYNAIHFAVSECLKQHNLTASHNLTSDAGKPFSSGNFAVGAADSPMLVNKLTGEIIEPRFQYSPKPSGQYSSSSLSERQQKGERSIFDDIFSNAKPDLSPILLANKNIVVPDDAQFLQIHNKYILTQSDVGILIIDQHNAHERILYESAIKMMNKELSKSQQLLFPVASSISPSRLIIAKEIEHELKDIGYNFTVDAMGNIEIASVPIDISEGEALQSFIEILDEYAELSKIKHSDKRDNLAASYSCKSAIKTGKKLTHGEMKSLANSLLRCSMPYVCPHGRPVILEISLLDLDKSFKRT